MKALKALWKSPVHRFLLVLIPIGIVYFSITEKDCTLAIPFILAVLLGELIWFQNIVNSKKD